MFKKTLCMRLHGDMVSILVKIVMPDLIRHPVRTWAGFFMDFFNVIPAAKNFLVHCPYYSLLSIDALVYKVWPQCAVEFLKILALDHI